MPGPPNSLENSVGQGPTVLAVGAVLGLFGYFSSPFSFSLTLGDGSIQTEILPHRVIKPNTNNH